MHKAHIGVDAEPSLLDVAECIPTERKVRYQFSYKHRQIIKLCLYSIIIHAHYYIAVLCGFLCLCLK